MIHPFLNNTTFGKCFASHGLHLMDDHSVPGLKNERTSTNDSSFAYDISVFEKPAWDVIKCKMEAMVWSHLSQTYAFF